MKCFIDTHDKNKGASPEQELTEEQFFEQFAALEEGLALVQIQLRSLSESAKLFGSLVRHRPCRHPGGVVLASRPSSRSAPTLILHSTRCQPVPNFPRLRALALFGPRPPQRVEGFVMPASKNQNMRRHAAITFPFLTASRPRGRYRSTSCATGLSVRFFRVTIPLGYTR